MKTQLLALAWFIINVRAKIQKGSAIWPFSTDNNHENSENPSDPNKGKGPILESIMREVKTDVRKLEEDVDEMEDAEEKENKEREEKKQRAAINAKSHADKAQKELEDFEEEEKKKKRMLRKLRKIRAGVRKHTGDIKKIVESTDHNNTGEDVDIITDKGSDDGTGDSNSNESSSPKKKKRKLFRFSNRKKSKKRNKKKKEKKPVSALLDLGRKRRKDDG
ncbi:hypothetical protein [Encephalitozoon cuniculi GB-M1]|uniref:Uncharacterized protein n=1 Tax=Encephalitozoon cuniculi (strain GB-M1) TaxID=284813 RepID=Q8SWG6_ENCCU|nr:uncharacterized protein ECU02_0170 [Encephalitozoon cuniculi GB-M1]CAD25048.1 hypothetical protein [Encephalitozoon cuniculi GB-M1]